MKVASQELCDGMFDNKNLDEDNTALAVYWNGVPPQCELKNGPSIKGFKKIKINN